MSENEIIDALDGLSDFDPEVAHGAADELLLAAVSPAIKAAYERVQNRCAWWACA